MKKTVSFLTVFLIMMISLGWFLDRDACFIQMFTHKFDTTVNIVTKPEKIKSNIYEIQNIANKHNISFIKEVYEPKNTRWEKQKVNIYIYLNDAKWFQKTFKSIRINENMNGINKFKDIDSISLLTVKKVRGISYSNINIDAFNGDYHIKGTPDDIQNFVKELNNNKDLNLEATIDQSFSVTSELTQKQVFLYIVSILIVIVSLIFCFAIYNSSLSKEISIVTLLGYHKTDFTLRKTIGLLGLPFFISLITTTSALYILVDPDSMKDFLFSLSEIYTLILFIAVVIFLFEFFILLRLTKKVNIISSLKGDRQSYHKSSIIVKVGSVTMVLYLLIVSIFGMYDYITLKPHISAWENSKNYANIACTWSWSYVENDEKFEKIVVPKLNSLWDALEEEGAILFDAPHIRQEEEYDGGYDDGYIEKQAFHGRYAYINENYLKLIGLVDKENKPLSNYKVKPDEWVIFVPENMRITHSDKMKIRNDHIDKSTSKKEDIHENYVSIKSGQTMFTFDSQTKVDEPNTLNYVFIMVHGKSLDPTGAIKLPSLINGKFHPYIRSSYGAYDSLKPIIDRTGSAPYILYLTSVYDEQASKVEEVKMEAFIYYIGFLLSLLIFVALIKIDEESYFYHHGQRINVSRLLGYDFKRIHQNKMIQNSVCYIASILLLLLTVISTEYLNHFGFFTPRDGWTANKKFLCIIISIVCASIGFMIEIKNLKKNQKSIVIRLKEGC